MRQLSEEDAWGSPPFPSEVDGAALIESEDNGVHISLKDAWSVPFPSAAQAAPASGEHHQRGRSGVMEGMMEWRVEWRVGLGVMELETFRATFVVLEGWVKI